METELIFKSFAFFDLETTSLPHLEFNKTKITQLSIIAVSVEHFLKDPGEEIKVMQKLNLFLNPCKRIALEATAVTGLTNEILQHENKFDVNTLHLLNSFFKQLQAPVCLIAHNGNSFDFKILKTEIDKLNGSLPDSIFCCDSLQVFRKIDQTIEQHKRVMVNGWKMSNWEHLTDEEINFMNEEILQAEKIAAEYESSDDEKEKREISFLEEYIVNDAKDMKLRQMMNEKTPNKPIKVNNINPHEKVKPEASTSAKRNIRRELFPSPRAKQSSPKKFSLREVYYRFFNTYPENSHNSEGDCLALLKCAQACNNDFIETIMSMNLTRFCEVKGYF